MRPKETREYDVWRNMLCVQTDGAVANKRRRAQRAANRAVEETSKSRTAQVQTCEVMLKQG